MEGRTLILYHCNEKSKCFKFVNTDGYLITSKEDGIWLGEGMYFWDNLSNANFWKNEKIRKDKAHIANFSIVCAKVDADKMLDLTDFNICNKISKMYESLSQKTGIELSITKQLGAKLNKLFEYFPAFAQEYHIIKVYGKYNKTPSNNLFSYDIHSYSPEPTLAIKCIYSIKNSKCILEKEFLEGEL